MVERTFRAVDFDYNGTLLYDAPNFYRAVCESIFDRYGVARPAFEEFRQAVGVDPATLYTNRGIGAPRETLQEHVTEWFSTHEHSKLAPGAQATLRALKQKSVSRGLITMLASDILAQEFMRHRIKQYFSFISSGLKEKQAAILESCNVFECDPGELVYVGDTPKDMREARAVGCFTVAYTRGYGSVQTLREEEPDLIINAWKEFLPAMKFFSQ